jgi:hypothetical protein
MNDVKIFFLHVLSSWVKGFEGIDFVRVFRMREFPLEWRFNRSVRTNFIIKFCSLWAKFRNANIRKARAECMGFKISTRSILSDSPLPYNTGPTFWNKFEQTFLIGSWKFRSRIHISSVCNHYATRHSPERVSASILRTAFRHTCNPNREISWYL